MSSNTQYRPFLSLWSSTTRGASSRNRRSILFDQRSYGSLMCASASIIFAGSIVPSFCSVLHGYESETIPVPGFQPMLKPDILLLRYSLSEQHGATDYKVRIAKVRSRSIPEVLRAYPA